MARTSSQATQAANSGLSLSNTGASNQSAIGSSLIPELSSFSAAPPGLNPAQYAADTTANMQSAGGTQAGAVGQGGLLAARTRNAGAPSAAISDSARSAGQQLSKANLSTQQENQDLKNRQQAEGLSGLEGMYGENLNEALGGLGQTTNAVNANTNQENASWDWAKDLFDPILQAAATGASGIATAGASRGCWIAEAVYGAEDPRTHIVRAYLNGAFRQTFIGSLVMRLYIKIGQRVAARVRRSEWLKSLFKPLFDIALKAGIAHYGITF